MSIVNVLYKYVYIMQDEIDYGRSSDSFYLLNYLFFARLNSKSNLSFIYKDVS